MKLTPHFTLEELTRSDYALRHGIDNTADLTIQFNLQLLCENVLEPIRERIALDKPIHITSGYRSPQVNAGIGGAATSQHRRGEAADFIIPGMSNRAVVIATMRDPDIHFDQLIYEGGEEGWIHVSYGPRHRRQVLSAAFSNGQAYYSTFA